MEKLPVEAKEKNVLYLSPLQKFTKESKSWLSLVPLGRNTLDRFVKDLCHEAGIEGKTNHSKQLVQRKRTERKFLKNLFNLGQDTKVLKHFARTSRVSTDQERSMCHVLGDVTNQ